MLILCLLPSSGQCKQCRFKFKQKNIFSGARCNEHVLFPRKENQVRCELLAVELYSILRNKEVKIMLVCVDSPSHMFCFVITYVVMVRIDKNSLNTITNEGYTNRHILKSVHCTTRKYICFAICVWVRCWYIYSQLWFLCDTMYCALWAKQWHPAPTFRAEQCKESLGGEKTRQRVMIYGLRRTNWWLVVTDSLVFIDLCFVFWITIPDLLCKQRSESAFRSKISDLHWGIQSVTPWIFHL